MNNIDEKKQTEINEQNKEQYLNGVEINKNKGKDYNNMYNNITRQEIAGYLLMTSGTLLLLYTLNILPILKYAIVASSISLILWGSYKAKIYENIKNMIDSYMNNKK